MAAKFTSVVKVTSKVKTADPIESLLSRSPSSHFRFRFSFFLVFRFFFFFSFFCHFFSVNSLTVKARFMKFK